MWSTPRRLRWRCQAILRDRNGSLGSWRNRLGKHITPEGLDLVEEANTPMKNVPQ
jgi:hypothetical protein